MIDLIPKLRAGFYTLDPTNWAGPKLNNFLASTEVDGIEIAETSMLGGFFQCHFFERLRLEIQDDTSSSLPQWTIRNRSPAEDHPK